MLRKRVSAKKKIEDKALAKKPVSDDESGRVQEPPCRVRKKGAEAEAETVKNQREIENGRKLGSWRSGGKGGSNNIVGDP